MAWIQALRVERWVHMDSGCEMFGSVAVHCGRTDPLGAYGRLDTGVVLAKNLATNLFWCMPRLSPASLCARRFSFYSLICSSFVSVEIS